MTGRADQVLREALELPTDERVAVATELLASLDDREQADDQNIEAAWAAEIERRARRVLSGGVRWETLGGGPSLH